MLKSRQNHADLPHSRRLSALAPQPDSLCVTRRRFGAMALGLGASFAAKPPLLAQSHLNARDFGIVAHLTTDQTAEISRAIADATAQGMPLFLPGGTYNVANLTLPSGAHISGIGGQTVLRGDGTNGILSLSGVENIRMSGIVFDGRGGGEKSDGSHLAHVFGSRNIAFNDCDFQNFVGNGVFAEQSEARVIACRASNIGLTAIHFQNVNNSRISDCRIRDCDNGAIRVWRYAPEFDGTVVDGNQISGIGSDWGNGQNGNGVNIFQANHVSVTNNVISDCDFSAIRANSTKNCIINSNQCWRLREVAIFSEFGFSGSVIADNIIDDAATGISITNLDHDGHLATCSGNIVRNITPNSPTNPDTLPVGIYVEAEVAVVGNAIENVPGVCIGAGWGSYLRNVLISDNVLRLGHYGIGVSVVDGIGRCHIANNVIAEMSAAAIAGFEWSTFKLDLLATDNATPQITLEGNQINA